MLKKKKIIAHIHVWDETNKGDLAIVMSTQALLRKKFSGCRIIDFPIEFLKEYDSKKITLLNSADLVVIGGGGILYRYFLPFSQKVIEAIKKPIIIFGVGYIREVGSRALKDFEVKSIVSLMAKSKLIGVRDYYTKQFLLKNGVNSKKINLIGDPAVLLEEKQVDLKLGEELKIGLNLNYSGWLGFGLWHDDILGAYRQVADYFIKKYNASIYYLKHHPGEEAIWPQLNIPGMKVIDYSPNEQKYFYGELDLVIGMMLHVSVMSFGVLTPEINVAYDLRNKNFAKFIGCPELVINLVDLKKGVLLKRAKEVVLNKIKYQKKFAVKVRGIRNRQNLFLDQMENFFNSIIFIAIILISIKSI
ncbi:MAG: polysaccharide pyruvyl transferase family protein [Patescibacteria group bacterium]